MAFGMTRLVGLPLDFCFCRKGRLRRRCLSLVRLFTIVVTDFLIVVGGSSLAFPSVHFPHHIPQVQAHSVSKTAKYHLIPRQVSHYRG